MLVNESIDVIMTPRIFGISSSRNGPRQSFTFFGFSRKDTRPGPLHR
jgi:hypothetical protein